jgi:hypothetical protein
MAEFLRSFWRRVRRKRDGCRLCMKLKLLNKLIATCWSGVFLLFSAGTLIFASTNVHLHGDEEEDRNMGKKEGIKELLAGAVGMCIPLMLGSLGHGH